ncbi:hypothetical protein SprV_0200818800 [Sparganum proliferum]
MSVPLDHFGRASRPIIMHLAKPLLHKAATTTEGCFVVISGASKLGFVQTVLFGEQVADGGVAVIEPVLMLATCATEDGQRRRLDCVPQLTPSVLNGGVLVSDGGGSRLEGWLAVEPAHC